MSKDGAIQASKVLGYLQPAYLGRQHILFFKGLKNVSQRLLFQYLFHYHFIRAGKMVQVHAVEEIYLLVWSTKKAWPNMSL